MNRIYVGNFGLDNILGGAERLGQQICDAGKLKYITAKKLGINTNNLPLGVISALMDEKINEMELDVLVHNSTNCWNTKHHRYDISIAEAAGAINISVAMENFFKEAEALKNIMPELSAIKKYYDWEYQSVSIMKSNVLVTLSNGEKKSFEEGRFVNRNIKVIEPFINKDVFYRKKEKIGKGRVLFVGREHPRKGFHIFKQMFQDRCFKEFKYITTHNLTEEQIAEEYRKADLCVFPSLYESFGYVFIESLMCGTPILASPVGLLETWKPEEFGIYCPKEITVEAFEELLPKAMEHGVVDLPDDVKHRFSKERFEREWNELLNNWR